MGGLASENRLDLIEVTISGVVLDEEIGSSGFGLEGERLIDRQTRAAFEAAKGVKAGFGYRYTVALTREQAASFAESLELGAAAKDPAFGEFSRATQRATFKAAAAIRTALK